MAVTRYELVETFDITRVHPDRDSIKELIEAANEHDDGESSWYFDGMCLVFKRPTGSSLTAEEGSQ